MDLDTVIAKLQALRNEYGNVPVKVKERDDPRNSDSDVTAINAARWDSDSPVYVQIDWV